MMDIAQEDNGRYAARTLSNISIASSASAKVQNPSVRGGHMQFDPSFTEPKHMGHRKVKFMCSSAGKILPRPSDMKLRYVGGETRMISVPRYIHYAAFLSKMVEIYGPEITLRYQLPEEDLDALVSVSSDEDLENMMEECDRLNSTEGLSRLRVFIFPDSELVVTDLRDMADPKTSEQKFVDAVNAMSADLPSGMHRNFTPAEDRFNDAYNAWNGIQMQEKGSLVYNNPRSEILPLEKYVPSENLHIIKNLMPNHESDPISPRPHAAFMGQPAFLARDAAADMLGNANNQYGAALDIDEFCDLERGGSEGSSVSSEHELHHKYAKNEWAPSSQMQAQKGLTSYDNGEDKTYRAEQRFVAEHATAGIEEHLNRVESVDEYKSAESQLHGDHLSLSPGAFLQKQLQADQPLSPGAFLQKQLQADRHQQETHSENFLVVNDMQPLPVNSGFRQHQAQQPAFPEQHELKDHHEWEGLPVYDSSILLDQETQAFGHLDCNSLRTQAVTANKVHLLSQETSAAVFPTSSAPPSPPRGKMESERNSDPFPQHANNIHEVSAAAFSALDYASTLDSVVQASSSNVSSLAMNTGGQQVQMHVTGFPGQITMQNYNHGHASQVPWVTSDPASYTFSSPDAIPRDEMLNQGNHQGRMMRKALDLYSDAPPTLVPSSVTTKQQFGLQNDDVKDFSPFLNRLHSPGLSLSQEYLPPGQSSTYAAVQHENEHFNRLSHYDEASPPSVMDNFPTLDMISDLLQSSQWIDCLPAESSTAGSVKSRSVCSLEELPHQEGNDLIARGGEESVLAEIDSSDLPLSMQRTSKDPSFPSIQNSLPSKEQFDKIMATTFTSAFNNETNLNDEQSLPRDREDTTVAASDSTALTSLIETWEASLLQDEHEQHAVMQHVKHEKAREEINLVHTVDKEDALEDSQIEFEELDEFESFNYGPMNAAAIAEAEAISRGLQTIRNYDLEELRELGSGTFGTVYHGKWRGTDVAIKRIKASCFTGRQAERERLMADFWREAYILGQLHHPNVVAFYGVVPDGPGGTLATVTEYMVNGSLKQVLQNKDRTLDRRKRLLIAMDAAFGMEYLHGKNVVHFDIKCENLLVNLRDTQRPICKVGDLGLSKVKQQTFVSGGVRGTLPWMAPELLNGSSSLVSEKVDVFSFGIVMWELLTGEEPYSNMHYGAIIGGIVSNTLRPTVPPWCDRAWRSLMEKCWAADPAERPTFLEIAGSLRAMETSLNAKGQGQAPITGLY